MPDASDVRHLFDQAVQLPIAERDEFVQRACHGDDALRQALERLLSAHERLGDVFETSPSAHQVEIDEPAPTLPETIGAYRIIREIGRGGSGAVYLGVRHDDAYEKTVAIKVLRHDLRNQDLVRRFRLERQILASIDHPLIAKLLDGNATPDGSPYLVMEYIDGLPIDVYCETHRLSVVERLKLFREVCTAVQFAHQRLVIHRDIKPGNILVTADGTPKLLDFGIAKLLDRSAFAVTIDTTLTGARLMTPEYASPEQIRGDVVTTATDVYSLGVVLYKLLTGRRPYRLRTGELPEIARAICEEEPTRPSALVTTALEPAAPDSQTTTCEGTPDRLRRRLQGDLDNIVLLAIRKEPQRRYASAEQLADDIDRHLANLPVRARPDTMQYRAAKFVRRHALGVATAALLALIVVGSAVALSVQAARLARERDRADQARVTADREAAKARAINEFLLRTLGAANPMTGTGRDVTLVAALGSAARTAQHALGDDPEVEAGVLNDIGQTFVELGRYDDATPLLERALQLRRDANARGTAMAESLDSLATLRRWQGAFKESEQLYDQALAAARADSSAPLDQVIEIMHGLGLSHSQRGDETTALSTFDQAMTLARHGGASERVRAELLSSSGISHRRLGHPAQAEAAYREALEIQRRLLGPQHPEVGTLLNNLGTVMNVTNRYAEAESIHREALSVRERALGAEHPYVANSLLNLAVSVEGRGNPTAALPLYQRAATIVRGALGADHVRLAQVLRNWGVLLNNLERPAEGAPLLRDALRIRRASLGPMSRDVADAELALARTLRKLGERREAEQLLRQALATNLEVLGADSEDVAINRALLGGLLCAVRPSPEALGLLDASVAYYQRHPTADPIDAAMAKSDYGECLSRARRFPEAQSQLTSAYERLTQLGPTHELTNQAARRLVSLYTAWGKPLEAQRYTRPR